MKRRDLLARIARSARASGREWELVRQGANHELWRLDDRMITIPRHREIRDLTAGAIMRALEPDRGEGWWRR